MLRTIHIRRSFIRVLACAIMLAGLLPRAHADHYSGSSITYECTGGNNYLITLDLFLDCTGAPLTAQSLSFSNSCGVSFTLNNIPLVLSEEVSQLCPSQLANSSCNGGPLPGMFHYQFQIALFLSPCDYWTIAWTICCRNSTQNVQATPGMYVAATLNNSGGLCDASPQFGDNTIPYVCVNQPVSYNPGVTDADGNTLVYSLIGARFAAPLATPVNYDPGYSAAQPIPGITLDPGSGQINFTPTVTGNYVVVIQVATYDINGDLIGTVMRDFLFVVINCIDPPPVTDGLTNATNGLITSSTGIEVCAGEPFCVDVVFEDTDPFTTLTVTSQGLAGLPGATITVAGTNPVTATFCWTPDAAFSPANIVISATDIACPIPNVASTAIFITVVDPPPVPPDAGTGTSVATCPGFPNIDLFSELGGTPDPGGYWTDPLGIAHTGTFLTASDPYGAYVYSVGNGCQFATAVVTITSNGGPDAGSNGSLTLCSNGSAAPLINSLGGTPDAGGSWSGPSPVAAGNYNPATMTPGVYTYTVTATPPCPNASATVTVNETAPPNAGTNGTLTLCSSSASTSMFAQLGGAPQAGGIWSGPSPVAGGNYNPATMNPGVYTYTVSGTAPCANASATVTVTENAAANAGTNGTLTVCGNSAAASLFAQLGGAPQAGGVWSGPSPVAGGNYDPATMNAGVYTYTVSGTAPCANATATVTVTENAIANAGTNGTLTVCSNGAAASLFAQLGGAPQAGGAWSGPSPIVGGNYDPATMTAGVYTYTVTGIAPCANASATVTVTENTAADAGTNGTLTVCANSAIAPLFAQLGGTPQAGGSWSGPSPVAGGNYDPATMTAGVYTYTVTGIAPCANASATVTVTENGAADAGSNGTLTVCGNGAIAPLFAQLGGAPQIGGGWSGPSPVVGGNYDPATMAAGVYTYTVTGTAPCANASATVTVTENAAADAGSNGTLAVCSNGATAPLFAQLGGAPQVGGAWSGPSPVAGGNYDPATMTAGVYTYTVTGIVPCANSSATVTVTENAAADAGSNGTLTVCGNGAIAPLFAQLGGAPQVGGAWSGPSPVVGGTYDPATMTAGVYTYTITGIAPCTNSSATVTVTENAAADAGSNGTLTVCGNGAIAPLFAQLGGAPQVGGAWSGPSPVVGGTYDPATMTAGVYTYTITGIAPCTNSSATVTVTENAAADAGINGTLTVCSDGVAVPLFAQLGGTPQPGGAWSGPSPVVGGNYDPATMNAGVYTYTLTGTAPCTDASATVIVTENPATTAGTDGTLTICASGAATSLLAQLGGTPQTGGSWSGPSPIVGGNYDPVTMVAGAYIYTVTGVAPCANAIATVTVTEEITSDAGTAGSLAICDNGAATSLFAALGGTAQGGGAWSGPSVVVGGNYDPATMTPGAYTYTVTGAVPCPDASASITVTESPAVDAGSDGALTLCSNGAAIDLFAQLGGSPGAGGTWSGPSPVIGNSYDPATMTAGVYTYTLVATAPCIDDQATVTITETIAADAGVDDVLTICDQGAATSLFAQLGGTPDAGGNWSGPSPVVGGNYDPATMTPGVYTYTVIGIAPCASASADITVNETSSPSAGVDGSVTVCNNGAVIDLFAQLSGSPDAGGTWSGPSPVGGSSYDPATMLAGVYTYTLVATAPCIGDQATVTITESTAADAGVDDVLTICDQGAATSLFAQLGGTPDVGGNWSGPSPVVGGNYDPATMTPGVYTYTVIGIAPCASASTGITVNETSSPSAGVDGSITVCNNGAVIDLFAQLSGSPDAGGTWSGPSPVTGSSYDPATMTAGVYTYTLVATTPCIGDQATVTITENTAADAGVDDVLTICDQGAATSLFAQLGGTPDVGGNWSGPSPVVGGNYDPATMTPGVYTYTVIGIAPCASASTGITVNETSSPSAGVDGSITVCNNGAVIDLFAQLSGSPDAGGTWSGPSPVTGSSYDPATMTAGVYTYTLVATTPCIGDQATVTITENTAADAGVDDVLTICDQGAATSLFAQLGGTPDVGGNWSGPSPVVGGNYDPATMTPGVYTYTVIGIAPCASASTGITVNETSSPSAGVDGSITVCNNGAVIDLFAQLSGSPDAGGTWSGPSPVTGSSYDPATMTAGVYTYTLVATTPCIGDQATVTITENTAADAGVDDVLTICDQGAATSLFAQLGGTPDVGGNWSGPSPVVGGNYDPATMTPGVYTYTVIGIAPCASASTGITVNETSSPSAGVDGSITVCNNGAVIDLFAQLSGSPDAGGTWSGPSPVTGSSYDPATMLAGVYTYILVATAPCIGDQSTVAVTENLAADAGTDNTLTVCDQGAAVSLFAALAGTPDAGGSWSGPSPVIGGNYDPALMTPGAYIYTIMGVAPCVDASATMTVNESSSPNAGIDGSVTVCSNGPAIDLFAQLGGSPDAGGTWSGPSPVTSGDFDPATMLAGVYTYALSASPPCVPASASVEVTIETLPNAGSSGTLDLCAGAGVIDLLTVIGGAQAGGTWTGPSGGVFDGTFDPGSDAAGIHTYTVTGVACPSASATATINLLPGPDAGVDNTISFCNTSPGFDLITQLNGTPEPGGTWTDDNGVPSGTTFDPTTMGSGTFTYTVEGSATCPDDNSVLIITVNVAPQAGTSGDLVLCESSVPVSLFDGLSGTLDAGGSWTDPSSAAHVSIFDPAIDAEGTYAYTVAGVAPCLSAVSTVNVQVNPVPDAGENGSEIYCSTNAPVALLSVLGGTPQPDGIWHGPGDTPCSGTFAPGSNVPGDYTYTITGIAPCGSDQAVVTIFVNPAANAGSGAAISLCADDPEIDLFTLLGGTPDVNGIWTAPDGSPTDAVFDPASDASGTYLYSVIPIAPCATATATVVVTVIPLPAAEILALSDGSCAPAEVTLSSGYTGPGSCTWILGNGEVVQDCGPIMVTYAEPGSYDVTLTIDAGNSCGSETFIAEDAVNVYTQPVAGFDVLPEFINTLDPVAFLNNTSAGAVSYEWDIAGLTTSSDVDVRYEFPAELGDEYPVCLVAIAASNCSDTICKVITVDDGMNVSVPNSFTPDGNGVNDTFKPIALGIDTRFYNFQIYDRWGVLIFSTQDPAAFWDGKLDGADAAIDVYVWKLTVKDAYSGERADRIGHVSLLR